MFYGDQHAPLKDRPYPDTGVCELPPGMANVLCAITNAGSNIFSRSLQPRRNASSLVFSSGSLKQQTRRLMITSVGDFQSNCEGHEFESQNEDCPTGKAGGR